MPAPLSTSQELRAETQGRIARAILNLPRPLLRRLAGEPPEVARGLEPEAWTLSRLHGLVARPLAETPVDVGRRWFELEAGQLGARPPMPVAAADLLLPGPAGSMHGRLFTPLDAPDRGPLLLYLHGGGWVRGSVTSHDGSCRLLALLAGVRVLSLEYRLAPEQRYPAAVDDALAAYLHVAAEPDRFGADPAWLAVGGDSAGGNLAAVLAQELRDGARAPAPRFQLLVYPACDLAETYESELLFGDGFSLTKVNMDWYCDQYVPDVELRRHPRVSPLYAPDLSGLAPAYVTTALADPLRDEGEAYARRMAEAGVEVSLQRQPYIHGFFHVSGTPAGRQAVALAAGAVRQALRPRL